ncbi:CYTH and CHAD domain-containing protein [Kangiella sp.]|uniref:CYTH and CHAD domain-containing protein n=1 Tax=Kangiella sp. TaxID=1920245 RepID=UPI0019C772E1|nr:CYTH and CHAD domain-containing protein [Kangiella sp.]MBD3654791.1 CYTH domain-containing protein [Kangiella sp.]
MSIEIEIKLSATPDKISDIKQWVSERFSESSEWQEKQLANTYFDTENHKLREMEIGLRIRRDGDKFIQSVKSAGRVVGGLFQRNESEIELPSNQLDLQAVAEPYLMILLEEAEEEDGPVQPAFNTDFLRRQIFVTEGDSQIEIALDVGSIRCKEEKKDICEVELELKEGEPAILFSLCQELIEKFDLVLDSESKAERGYTLCQKPSPYLRQLRVVELTAKSSAEAAFETIAHTGLGHWQHYIKQIKREVTIDNVLQLNRALMFMQHMYSVFAPMIPRHALSSLRSDWREITKNFAKLLKVAQEINWLNNGKLYGFTYEELSDFEKGLRRAFKREGSQFTEYLKSASYNLKLLHFSRWLYLKEWRLAFKEGGGQRLKKEIFPFAIRQLQHQLFDIKRHLTGKGELTENDYLAYLPRMYRTLDIGLFFGSLFENKKRKAYRQRWVDLVASIELFKQLEFIRRALKTEDRIDERLERTEKDILEALVTMRTRALEENPYWN